MRVKVKLKYPDSGTSYDTGPRRSGSSTLLRSRETGTKSLWVGPFGSPGDRDRL